MRVLIVSPYPPSHTGPAQHCQLLARELARRGHEVEVLANANQSPEGRPEDRVTIVRGWHRGPHHVLGILAGARRTQAEVIHMNFTFTMYGGPVSALLAPWLVREMSRRRPVVVTLFDVLPIAEIDRATLDLYEAHLPPSLVRAGMRWVLRSVARHAERVVVQNAVVGEILRKDYGVPPEKIVTTPCPVYPFSPPLPIRSGPPAHPSDPGVGLSPRRQVLCYGFLAPYKGIEVLLQALARVRGRVPPEMRTHLVIAGETHPRLRYDYRSTLERLGQELGLTPEDVSFRGYVEDEEAIRLCVTSDAVILPYLRTTGASGTLATAIGLARPVVVTHLSHLVDQLGAYPAARVIPPGNVEEMARVLTEIGSGAFVPRRPIPPGGSRAPATWGQLAQETIDLYRSVCAARAE